HRVGVRMALLEVCEVRELGMLKEPTTDVLGRKKVSHRSASIAAHVDESTSAPGREAAALAPGVGIGARKQLARCLRCSPSHSAKAQRTTAKVAGRRRRA